MPGGLPHRSRGIDTGSATRGELSALRARALRLGLAAVFTFPLRHGDARLGALDLYRETVGPLSPESWIPAQTLADVAAAYLINAQARADLQASSEQSREAALHDPLTGLPNRVLMLQLIEHAIRAAQRSARVSAVLFIDLDRFKEVNDTHGHQVGDELLVGLAERLSGLLRPGDSLGRLSGDEFVVLCEDLDDAPAADPIAARLGAELAQPFPLSQVEVTITASLGMAFTGRGQESAEELLGDADLAMYRAKRQRRGTAHQLDLRQLHLAGRQPGLARSLPGASDRSEFHLDYQPIVDAADRQVCSVEALLRWTHATRGPISPAVFIPFAEQSGQIIELGRWVLEQACSDRRHWQRGSSMAIGVSVNVSTHQFLSGDFVPTVSAALESTSTDPPLLTLEITESVFVRDGGARWSCWPSSRTSASSSPSMISGPDTPRSANSEHCASTRSRWVRRSLPTSITGRAPRRSSRRSSGSHTVYRCRLSPRGSRMRGNTRR